MLGSLKVKMSVAFVLGFRISYYVPACVPTIGAYFYIDKMFIFVVIFNICYLFLVKIPPILGVEDNGSSSSSSRHGYLSYVAPICSMD